jgi:hypothetical protein
MKAKQICTQFFNQLEEKSLAIDIVQAQKDNFDRTHFAMAYQLGYLQVFIENLAETNASLYNEIKNRVDYHNR